MYMKTIKRWAGSPYVFPGEGHGKRKGSIASISARRGRGAETRPARRRPAARSPALVRVGRRLGRPDLPIIGALLGHSQAQTTQRYAHLMDDPLRAASAATGATIAAGLARSR